MGTTPRGYRYPDSTSSVNVPGDIQNLASDVDTEQSAMWPATVQAIDGAATDGTFTSAFPTFTDTTTQGTLGVAFVAPKSGRVKILFACGQGRTTVAGAVVVIDFSVRAGGSIGSGTSVSLAGTKPARQVVGESHASGNNHPLTGFDLISGLTPGSTYNVVLSYAVTGGTATVNRRNIVVEPAS